MKCFIWYYAFHDTYLKLPFNDTINYMTNYGTIETSHKRLDRCSKIVFNDVWMTVRFLAIIVSKYIDGLMQERPNSSVLAIELRFLH